MIRLNANESPWKAPGDPTIRGLNIYPPPRPIELTARLSEYYGIDPTTLLVTRGTSEAIDVLVRGFCVSGHDQILICPPTFDMYRLYAGIQGADVLSIPLLRDDNPEQDFNLDVESILATCSERTKLVFICSPNNPTGRSMAASDVAEICHGLAGRSLVVIDEAYQEFSESEGFSSLQAKCENVVLLRTLSKFASLAGVRCGGLIGCPELVTFLNNVLPPYTFPTPSIEFVMTALEADSLRLSGERNAILKAERHRVASELANNSNVFRVWRSDANFVLIEANDGQAFAAAAREAGILVRTFPNNPSLTNCVRITIGQHDDNSRLLSAVSSLETSNAD